jgi:hypothetical protein
MLDARVQDLSIKRQLEQSSSYRKQLFHVIPRGGIFFCYQAQRLY